MAEGPGGLAGGTCLVTGASRGIGRAVALALAELGGRIAVHFHRNAEAADGTVRSLPGGTHRAFAADLRDAKATAELVSRVEEAMGPIAVLVNNAGIFTEHPLLEVPYEEWLRQWSDTLDTNLLGPANLCYCVARRMAERGGGKIVNVSSRGAFRGEPEAPAYGASKAGVNALSQSLARALAPHGVFVYAVAPGFVETDMVAEMLEGPEGEAIRAQSPLHRVARPEEVARAVAFLASPGTDFLTGCIVDVNGASYLRS